MKAGIIARYRKFLPITDKTPIISLGEGSTPLIKADRLAKEIGFYGHLHLKFEGANPTGSFKDRGMTVAVSKALEEGAEMLMCASTGNTASSAAAYGAAAGLPVIVLIPKGGVAQGKLGQMRAYGAKVVEINSTFDKCQDITRELAAKFPEIALVNSINPNRLEGQKTAAFEIWEKLGKAPDYHFIPVGNAGNITAYWMGYQEYKMYIREQYINNEQFFDRLTPGEGQYREISHSGSVLHRMKMANQADSKLRDCNPHPLKIPKMMGYQAAGAAPIVLGNPVVNPQTIASAIRVGNPASWEGALTARDESGGVIDCVTDEEILVAYELTPRLTGFYCEPASAAAVAGLQKAIREYPDFANSEDTVAVCILTGNGLKDPDTAKKFFKKTRSRAVPPDLNEIIRRLKL